MSYDPAAWSADGFERCDPRMLSCNIGYTAAIVCICDVLALTLQLVSASLTRKNAERVFEDIMPSVIVLIVGFLVSITAHVLHIFHVIQ